MVTHNLLWLIFGKLTLWLDRATVPGLFIASVFRVLLSVFLFGIGLFEQVDVPADRRGCPQTKAL